MLDVEVVFVVEDGNSLAIFSGLSGGAIWVVPAIRRDRNRGEIDLFRHLEKFRRAEGEVGRRKKWRDE